MTELSTGESVYHAPSRDTVVTDIHLTRFTAREPQVASVSKNSEDHGSDILLLSFARVSG